MRVMRVSPSLTASPAPMCSAPVTIVRSLSTSNARPSLPDAPLAVDRAAARLEADRDDRGEQQGRCDEQRRAGDDHVEDAARHQRVPSGGVQPAGVPWRR